MKTPNIPALIAVIRGGSKALTREAEMSDDIETLRRFLYGCGHELAALDRLQARVASLQQCTVQGQEMAKEQMDRCVAAERERDSLRAKLERAKEVLSRASREMRTLVNYIRNHKQPMSWASDSGILNDMWAAHQIYETTLSELSDDTPAQQTQRDVITRDRDIILQALVDYDAWMLDDDYDATTALHNIMKRMRERAMVEPAQQTQISDEVREAMVEAEKAFEPKPITREFLRSAIDDVDVTAIIGTEKRFT